MSMRRSAQEAQRIALEQNLQRTDLSLDFDSSVEYPRHVDLAPNTSVQGWFEDDQDDEGINPYAGETLSTAAHHASALTLSAGLRGHRRDTSFATSLSGAEYDPDRPVSLLSMDPVFDKSNELDRLLQSGHQQRSVRMRSPLHSYASSSSDTESNRSFGSRPKISDALRNDVTFSPKRPKNSKSSPAIPRVMEDNNATPKPRRQHSAPAAAFSGPAKPDLRVQPPTPSSKVTKTARDLSREVQQPQRHPQTQQYEQKLPTPSPLRRGVLKSNSSSRIHLPDVTGLTSAVESPAKGNLRHAQYVHGRQRESEGRLLAIIGSVQTQLNDLERENSVSRRRVRELEAELEDCKREVRRERARVDDLGLEAERLRKGKARAREDEADVSIRYREVVEEKKALEALLNTLHTHLARLTKELQTHQKFLQQLRQLRETDTRVLTERGEEIQKLREEVGRLGGEVEVLRGVVEDGLRERRERIRQQDPRISQSVADTGMSLDQDDEEEEEEQDEPEPEPFDPASIPGSSRDSPRPPQEVANSTFIHPRRADRTMRTDFSTAGGGPSQSRSFGAAEAPSMPAYGESFMAQEEIARISRDVQRRRAGESESSEHDSDTESRGHKAQSYEEYGESPSVIAATRKREREATRHKNSSAPPPRPSAPTPKHASSGGVMSTHPHRPKTPPRPSSQASRPHGQPDQQQDGAAPFPKIRGEHMERLFFSAPPHDAHTCKVCHRHRQTDASDVDEDDVEVEEVKSRLPSRREQAMLRAARDALPPHGSSDDEDEGFVEGDDIDLENEPTTRKWARQAKRQGVPPQTVVARVIRELEDDFTHYKSIYVELADTYKVLDAASDVPKRNLLAKHLKEVVDILENKGDQIASLYDLLAFKDKTAGVGAGPSRS